MKNTNAENKLENNTPIKATEYDSNWRMLAAAVVVQAIRDYKCALKEQRHESKRKCDAQYSIEELHRFFASEWCSALVSMGTGTDCCYSESDFEKRIDKLVLGQKV